MNLILPEFFFLILNSIPATGITRILYVILTQLTRTVT